MTAALSRMRRLRPSNYLPIQREPNRRCISQNGEGFYTQTISNNSSFHKQSDDRLNSTASYRSYSISSTILASSPAIKPVDLVSDLEPSSSYTVSREEESRRRDTIKISSDKDITSSTHLPKQSTYTTRILFDTIAPHIELRTLDQLTKSLSRIDLDDTEDDREGKKVALQRTLDVLFQSESTSYEKLEDIKKVKYSWGIKGHPWMRSTIKDYCLGKKLDKPNDYYHEEQSLSENDARKPLPHEKDPTYPPNRNRQLHQQHLKILLEAREVSLRHPIFWSEQTRRASGYSSRYDLSSQQKQQLNHRDPKLLKQREYHEKLTKEHSKKRDDELLAEAEDMLEVLTTQLPPPHFNKFMGRLRGFVSTFDDESDISEEGETVNSNRSSNSDSWYIDDAGSSSKPLPELPEVRSTHADYKKHRIPILGSVLKACSLSHSHLVGYDLAGYFYMEIPKSVRQKQKDDEESSSSRSTDTTSRKPRDYANRQQKDLLSTVKKYYRSRDEFIKKMMTMQHYFASSKNERSDKRKFSDIISLSKEDLQNEHDLDLSVNELQKAQSKYSLESRKKQNEELSETLMGMREINLEGSDTRSKGTRKSKTSHLRLTAVSMEDDKSQSSTENSDGSNERIMFINNLPIDITEDEVDEIYSRCGPLDSIKLFNLRPDLDPGPLSKAKKLERRRKKQLKRKSNSYKEPKHRPRSPVYGMLRFKTDKGYKAATRQELCIFGCVIRRHPVMSIKPDDMNTLYLEQLTENLYSEDVENELSQLLQPNKMSIMLDRMRGGDRMAGSCQIQFDDFHSAFKAYQLIQGEDVDDDSNEEDENTSTLIGEDSQVQWFRTPLNSMDYWTRAKEL